MNRLLTIVLRAVIILMAVIVSLVCIFLLPSIWDDVAKEFPNYSYAVYAVLLAMVIAVVPFFVGLTGAWRLLTLIDKKMPFTRQAAKLVATIAFAAGTISFVYVVAMPFFFIWADNDDAPGLIVIGAVLVGVSMVVAVFASLLYRLVTEATVLKAENELTV